MSEDIIKLAQLLWHQLMPSSPPITASTRRHYWFSEVPLASVIPSVAEMSFRDRSHIQTLQVPKVLVDAFRLFRSINHSKIVSGPAKSARIERYRWHMPAGFLGYLLISLLSVTHACIRRHICSFLTPWISVDTIGNLQPLRPPKRSLALQPPAGIC